jgi:hypothetical protein
LWHIVDKETREGRWARRERTEEAREEVGGENFQHSKVTRCYTCNHMTYVITVHPSKIHHLSNLETTFSSHSNIASPIPFSSAAQAGRTRSGGS